MVEVDQQVHERPLLVMRLEERPIPVDPVKSHDLCDSNKFTRCARVQRTHIKSQYTV